MFTRLIREYREFLAILRTPPEHPTETLARDLKRQAQERAADALIEDDTELMTRLLK